MSRLAPAHFATLATLVLFGACGTTPTGNGGTDILFTLATVDVGRKHSCGLTTSRMAYCWGDNTEGQLGDASNISSTRPVPVAGGRLFVDLTSGGWDHTCALTAEGEAYCWGQNWFGQLGDGTTMSNNEPVRAAGSLTFTSLDAGVYHTCGLTSTGAAYCWGSNGDAVSVDGFGLGAPTTQFCDNPVNYRGSPWECSPTPIAVSGGISFRSISSGLWATCGVALSRAAYCWGWNPFFQLGTGTDTSATAPTLVAGGLLFDDVTLGATHGCGLVNRDAYCWGGASFNSGQLGTGSFEASSTPAPAVGGLSFSAVIPSSANNLYAFTCGLTTAGAAYCWGSGRFGGLGTDVVLPSCTFGGNVFPCSNVPVPVAGGIDFISLATGHEFACGVGQNGAGYCWGQNDTGQLGDGTTTDSTVPVRISDPQ